jgi:hypothetical protein
MKLADCLVPGNPVNPSDYPARQRIDRFFPKNFTEKQKEDLIVQLLESWYKKRQREQER